jgi:TRAP-type C4-dicarboxylate transport system substrate-binding protein
MSVTDAPANLAKGTMGAIMGPATYIAGIQMCMSLKHVNPVKIRYSPALALASVKAWNMPPEKYHKRPLDLRNPMDAKFNGRVRMDNATCIAAMVNYGVKKVEMTPAEIARELARPKRC